MSEYWTICAEEALDEIGFSASSGQVATLADHMRLAHDSYADQHGHAEADRSLWRDLTRRAEAAEERASAEAEKVPCPECAGKVIPALGGTTQPARFECWRCNRTGKVQP